MKKNLILIIIAGVLLIGAVTAYLFLWGPFAKPEPTDTVLELEFDQQEDLDWVHYFIGENASIEDTIHDGFIRFEDSTIRGISVKYGIRPGMVAHARVRISPQGPGFFVGFGFDFPNDKPGEYASFRMGGMQNEPYSIEPIYCLDHFGNDLVNKIDLQGSAMLGQGQWVDMIFWLPENGNEVYFFIADAENEQDIIYASVELTEDWSTESWRMSMEGFFGRSDEAQYMDLDYINISYGPIENYLYYHVPAYLHHKDRVNAFLSLPPDKMPELYRMGEE